MTTTIHCSALDLGWTCAESIPLTGAPTLVDPHNEMAELGTAAHRAAVFVDRDEDPPLSELAECYGVDLEDLTIRWHLTRKAWKDVRLRLGGGDMEVSLSYEDEQFGVKLVGTCDRFNVQGNAAFAADWKFGYLEQPHNHQLAGYGFLIAKANPEVEKFWSGVCYVMLGVWVGRWFTRQELDDWFAELCRRIELGRGSFTPGHHCRFCHRQYDCPGFDAYRSKALAFFAGGEMGAIRGIAIEEPPDVLGPQLSEALRTWKLVEKYGKELKAIARQYAEKHDGFPTGDGRRYTMTGVDRRLVDPRKAWPVLVKMGFTEDDLGSVASISLASAKAIISDRTERGQKKKAIEELEHALEVAGAVTTKTTKQLREVSDAAE